jgi:hypothetical protein
MAQADRVHSTPRTIASKNNLPAGADQTILSDMREIDGASEDAVTIPAINPIADRRSDIGQEVANTSAIAPPARTSRRGFLMNTMVSAASLATATAIAIPSLAAQAATSTEGDAGLIMLGKQFDVAVKDVIAAREKLDTLSDIVYEAAEANATWPDNQNDWSRDDAKHYFAALTAAQRDVGGPPFTEADAALNEAYGRTDEMSKMIGTLPAHTVEGLVVKARVTALACAHLWGEPIKEIDWDKEHARRLVEATFQAAGVETVEGYLGSITTPMSATLRTPLDDALDRHQKAGRLFDRIWNQLDAAKYAAAEKHGHRPIALIAWRNYSHIGGGEIERVRKEFLERGMDASIVEQEYLDAKRRYKAIVKAGKDWDRRAGLASKSKAVCEARAELHAANKALGSVELRSVADASALLDFVYANLKRFHGTAARWEMAALRNATSYLNRLTVRGKAAGALAGRRSWQA